MSDGFKRQKSKPGGSRRKGPARPAAAEETLRPTLSFGGVLRALGYYCLIGCVWVGLGLIAFVAFHAASLPATTTLWEPPARPHAIKVLAKNGKTLALRGVHSGADVKLKDLPAHVPNAVIATEDRRFYQHFGLDLFGILRALWVNVEAGRVVQGGSTISQQLAKNLFLQPARTMSRKVQEALLAFHLETSYTKDEIITLYLNTVYFGAGAYGIDAAAWRYFNKPASRLSLIEAAILAGVLKAPSRFSPTNDQELAFQRAHLVLNEMWEAGFITQDQRDAASRTRPKLAPNEFEEGSQYFVNWVLERLPGYIGRNTGDVIVETTLDLEMQAKGEAALTGALDAQTEDQNIGQGALIALSPDGAIRAMVGGRSYRATMFNRAAQAKRQPGSAFKPFVFLTALENGMTPSDKVLDAAFSRKGWNPQNFEEGKRTREITLTLALAQSVNTAAARLGARFGARKIAATAHRLGIQSEISPFDSIALGTEEVTLLELANAYAPFANGGQGVIAYGIERVKTMQGEVLYERSGSGIGMVVAPAHVAAMNHMLREAMHSGTGRRANIQPRPAAGKTGTTQDFRDAWFIGYTADLIAGVWVGNDNGAPMGKVTGGNFPTLVWKVFMERALDGAAVRPLPGLGAPAPALESAAAPDAAKSTDDPEAFDALLERHANGDASPAPPAAPKQTADDSKPAPVPAAPVPVPAKVATPKAEETKPDAMWGL